MYFLRLRYYPTFDLLFFLQSKRSRLSSLIELLEKAGAANLFDPAGVPELFV
jgi:hypothetical protein